MFKGATIILDPQEFRIKSFQIQCEVERFIEDYIRSIEEHKSNLLEQIRQLREEKMQQVIEEKLKLQKKIRDARDIAYFLDDLLSESSDVEVLSFIKPIIKKIEGCDNLEPSPELKYSDSIQFLPEESVKDTKNAINIYGVLTTQNISAEHCRINTKSEFSNFVKWVNVESSLIL